MTPGGTRRLVVERELREAFRRRSFWITIALFLLGSTALVVIPEFIGDDGAADRTVVTVGVDEAFAASLRQLAPVFDIDVDLQEAATVEAARTAVDEGDADVAVDLTVDPALIVARSEGSNAVTLVRQAVTVSVFTSSLTEAGLGPDRIAELFAGSDPRIEELEPVDNARRGVAAVVAIVLYLLLLLLSTSVATGVAIEKSNRVSEVLLAIVPARHLLFGKVMGVAIVGLVSLAAGALPIVVSVTAGGSLPDGIGGTVLGSTAWFVMGLALYLTAAGALGALVDRQEEVGATIAPLSTVLIAAYLVGVSSPDSPVATVLAYVPFTSPMVMPARIALGVASPVEMAVSLVLGVLTVIAISRLAALVYRRAIVRTGRKVSLRQVLRAPT
jgi:ABC-2 type transport system permease protein